MAAALGALLAVSACSTEPGSTDVSREQFDAFVEALGPTDGRSDLGCPLLDDDELRQITQLPADAEIEHQVIPEQVYCDIEFSSMEDLAVIVRVVPDGSSLAAETSPRAERVEEGLSGSERGVDGPGVDRHRSLLRWRYVT